MTDQQRQPPGASHESDSNPEAASDLAWLTEHQLQGQVSKVAPNTARSNNLLKQAQTHINSARTLAATDPTLALAGLHDGVRKAVDADAGALGFRFENKPGAHKRVLEYGAVAIGPAVDPDDFAQADRLRSRRHEAEYGEVPSHSITPEVIGSFAEVADRIVKAAIARQIARTAGP